MKELHNVKITKNEYGQNNVFLDDKFIYGVTEANIFLKGGEIPQVVLTMDSKNVDIEINAEVKEVQATKEKIVVVKYETSQGLEKIIFKDADKIRSCVDEDKRVIFIEEWQENRFLKGLAVISLDNFVSYEVKEIENK